MDIVDTYPPSNKVSGSCLTWVQFLLEVSILHREKARTRKKGEDSPIGILQILHCFSMSLYNI